MHTINLLSYAPLRLIGVGKLGAAIESLQQALRHDPADARTHYCKF